MVSQPTTKANTTW